MTLMTAVPGYSQDRAYLSLDIPQVYRRAADLLEERGMCEPGYDVDIDGRLSVDGACRRAMSMPPRFEDLGDDKVWLKRNERIVTALCADLRCLPAAWDGTERQTVDLLRAAAEKREAQTSLRAVPA